MPRKKTSTQVSKLKETIAVLYKEIAEKDAARVHWKIESGSTQRRNEELLVRVEKLEYEGKQHLHRMEDQTLWLRGLVRDLALGSDKISVLGKRDLKAQSFHAAQNREERRHHEKERVEIRGEDPRKLGQDMMNIAPIRRRPTGGI